MAALTSARSRRTSPFRRGGRRCASHRRRATGAPTDNIPCDTVAREWTLTQPPQSAAQSRAEAAAVRRQLSYAGSTNGSVRGLSPVGATARPTQARPGRRRTAGTTEYTSKPPGTSGRRLQRSDSSGGVRLRRDGPVRRTWSYRSDLCTRTHQSSSAHTCDPKRQPSHTHSHYCLGKSARCCTHRRKGKQTRKTKD